MNYRKIFLLFSSAFLILITPRNVQASDIAISGNGSESTSSVNVSQTTTTTVSQTNTNSTNNDVTTNANTGNNTTNNNTNGTIAVQTGNVSTDTTIKNSGNTATAETSNCCETQGSDVSVSDNGAGSTNTADLTSTNQNTVTVTQHTTITNSITGSAVTGNNHADNNNGNVFIKTGDIHVNESVKNGPINVSHISVPQGSSSVNTVKISGNGASSKNAVTVHNDNNSTISIINLSDIINISSMSLETGGNTASFNNGNVSVQTGNITQTTIIENGPINVSSVTVKCCNEEKQPSPAPTPQTNAPTPSNPSPSNGGNGSSGNNPSIGVGGPGEVLAATVGKILPATGSNWLFFATLANIVMLFLGVILRLRSGRSPGFVFQV